MMAQLGKIALYYAFCSECNKWSEWYNMNKSKFIGKFRYIGRYEMKIILFNISSVTVIDTK